MAQVDLLCLTMRCRLMLHLEQGALEYLKGDPFRQVKPTERLLRRRAATGVRARI